MHSPMTLADLLGFGFDTDLFEVRVFRATQVALHDDGVGVTDHNVWFASEHELGRWLAFADLRDGSMRAGIEAWERVDTYRFANQARFVGQDFDDVAAAPIAIARLQRRLLHLMPHELGVQVQSSESGAVEALRDIVDDEIAEGHAPYVRLLAEEDR